MTHQLHEEVNSLAEGRSGAFKGQVRVEGGEWQDIARGRTAKAAGKSATYFALSLIQSHFSELEINRTQWAVSSDFYKAAKAMKLGIHGGKGKAVVEIQWRAIDAEGNEVLSGWRHGRAGRGTQRGKGVGRA